MLSKPSHSKPHPAPITGLVSVIIPCYNQEAYLREAIGSVFQQSYFPIEVIVVDDGSTGNVAAITALFPGVRLIRQANLGAAHARNRGMAEAGGDYLVFLDADDRLLPGALEQEVALLRAQPDLAFVSGQVQLIDAQGRLQEIPDPQIVNGEHFRFLLQSNYIWTPGAVMYRKAVFEREPGFDPGAGGSADYELNIRLARQYPVGMLESIVLEYRVHEENMSSNAAYMLRSGIRVRWAQYPFVKKDPALLHSWKRGIRAVQQDAGERLLHQLAQSWRQRKLLPTIGRDLWYLLKYYPLGLPKRLVRRIWR